MDKQEADEAMRLPYERAGAREIVEVTSLRHKSPEITHIQRDRL